jgi:hypothetical protein
MNLLISVMGECSVKNGQKPWGGMLLDNKVSLFRSFSKVFKFFGRSKDIKILRTRPGNAPADWKPEFTFNILSYPNIPVVALAKLIIDTGDSVGGGSGEGGSSNFWRTQAIDHIAQAIRFLRCTHTLHKLEGKELANLPEKELAIYEKMPKYSSMKGVYHLIMNIDDLTQYVGLLDEILPLCDNLDKRTLEEFNIATEHFKVTFIKKSETNAELLDNLQSTMQNYLSFFQNRDIQEVFCQEENSFEFESIDDGTFFTIVMPPKYAFERKFIFVFFKLLYFYHGLERGSEENLPDLPNKNLLILWMDEYQEIITAVPGASDFAFAAQAREFRTTMVAATQSIDALISGGIKEDDVKTQLSNMANILCFQASTKRTATMIEETYPEVKKKEVTSISKGRRGDKNTTISIKHEAKYTANELRNLKKYQCAVTHCDETYPKRLMLKPRMPDGSISFFYHWKINPLYWVKKFIQSRKF